MKKLLLSFCTLTLLAASSFGQEVIVEGIAPASIAATLYDYGKPAANPMWGADLDNPDNAVTDTLALASDSLACTTLAANSLSGKIAFIYRGTCEFSAKALAAQNAGAVAVVIVNNVAGAPAGMLAGAGAASVSIPVVMISQADGATLRALLNANQDVVLFIGEKTGHFADDIGFHLIDALRANSWGIPSYLAQTAAEFDVDLGSWVHNPGINDQTGVTLQAIVKLGSTTLYDETSTAFNLPSGDSIFITMPNFNEATYGEGIYDVTYSISSLAGDLYPNDNRISWQFSINDSIYSLGRLDNTSGLPEADRFTQPNPINTLGYTSCIVFRNTNASRIGVQGMYFSAAVDTPAVLTGRQILVSVSSWDDVFVDASNATFDNVNEITSGIFDYTSDNNTPQYAPFDSPVVLEDNTRYLFCAGTFDAATFLGYDNVTHYDEVIAAENQPLFPINNGTSFSLNGFVGLPVPGLAVKVFDADNLGIKDKTIETAAFPNPAKDQITVKVNASGAAKLQVADLTGRTVLEQNVTIAEGQFTLDVSGMNAGTYVFSLAYANGTSSQFKVVVTK